MPTTSSARDLDDADAFEKMRDDERRRYATIKQNTIDAEDRAKWGYAEMRKMRARARRRKHRAD